VSLDVIHGVDYVLSKFSRDEQPATIDNEVIIDCEVVTHYPVLLTQGN